MPRGASKFRQVDVERVIRAAFKAGAGRATVKIGEMEMVAERPRSDAERGEAENASSLPNDFGD